MIAGKYKNVNFKDSVARAFLILGMVFLIFSTNKSNRQTERAAAFRNPRLTRHPTQTVRDYILSLREHCADLNYNSWRGVIEGYEKARFGRAELTKQEFSEFMQHLTAILTYLENL